MFYYGPAHYNVVWGKNTGKPGMKESTERWETPMGPVPTFHYKG